MGTEEEKTGYEGIAVPDADAEILQEKCGIIGILSNEPEILQRMAITSLPTIVHRGADGTGYAFVGAETVKYHSLIPANQFAQVLAKEEPKDSSIVLLQSRYATAGDARKREELQPFLRATNYGKLALAFNGNIWNWNRGFGGNVSLKERAQKEGVIYPDGESTDTESFFYLLSKSDRKSLINALMKDVLPSLRGGYSLLIAQEGTVNMPDTLIAARDPHGLHPLWWAQTDNGEIVVASETCSFDALRISHARFHEVKPGTMLVFEKGKDSPVTHYLQEHGEPSVQERHLFEQSAHTGCSLELMYFMRTDSLFALNPQNHEIKTHIIALRRAVGKVVGERALKVLKEMGYENFDNLDIIPIPESGLPFGRGVHDSLAKEGAHLNEEAVILNPDAPKKRSFISKDEAARRLVALEKRKFLRDLFNKNRDHLVCDDTLIRGTTFKKLLQDLRKYISGRIHAVFSLDKFVDICPYGIAIKKPEELVTRLTGSIKADDLSQVDLEPIKEYIGMRPDEMLLFGTPEEIRMVVRAELAKCGLQEGNLPICFACQGGDYPDEFEHTPVTR